MSEPRGLGAVLPCSRSCVVICLRLFALTVPTCKCKLMFENGCPVYFKPRLFMSSYSILLY